MNIKLGAMPSPKDERDLKFKALGGAIAKVEPYQSIVPIEIVNQESSMQCGGCAGAMYRREREYYQTEDTSLFSHTYIYGADSNGAEGMYGRALASILRVGVPHEQSWESWCTKSEARKLYLKHMSELEETVKPYRCSSYYFCDSWKEILNAIRTCNGCIIMVPVYPNWYNVKSSGIVGKNQGILDGYHFILAKDYVQEKDGSYTIRFVNSWGTDWGQNGIGYLNTSVNQFEEAFALVDDIEEVKKAMNFEDINETMWGYNSIKKAYDKGIIDGFEDGTFRPDEPLTRRQWCVLMDRLGYLD